MSHLQIVLTWRSMPVCFDQHYWSIMYIQKIVSILNAQVNKFNKCICPCGHKSKHRTLTSPQKVPFYLFEVNLPAIHISRKPLICICCYKLNFPYIYFHINETMSYTFFLFIQHNVCGLCSLLSISRAPPQHG